MQATSIYSRDRLALCRDRNKKARAVMAESPRAPCDMTALASLTVPLAYFVADSATSLTQVDLFSKLM